MKADIEDIKPRYIAQFTSSEQFSPDDWKVVTPAMMATDETTIGEIREWMDSKRAKFEKEFKVIILE